MTSCISLCLIDGMYRRVLRFDTLTLILFLMLLTLLVVNAVIDIIKLLKK